MVAKTVEDALVVPAQALVSDEEGKKSVMVVGSDGVAHKRDVDVGIQTSDTVQLLKGVKPGEHVVVKGLQQIRAGMRVEPILESPLPTPRR